MSFPKKTEYKFVFRQKKSTMFLMKTIRFSLIFNVFTLRLTVNKNEIKKSISNL